MTSLCGAVLGEGPLPACHTTFQEPPTPGPLPALDGVASSQQPWGKSLGKKPNHMFHLCFQNIGSLSQSDEGDRAINLPTLLHFVNQYQVDAFAFTKHNTCWDLLPPEKRLLGITRGWWENAHWSIVHNCIDNNQGLYQPSGTGLVIVNSFSHSAQRPSSNRSGLGRWVWVQL